MSVLQPKVRLYKLVYGAEDSRNPIAQPEFIFSDFYSTQDVDSIFSANEFARIGGVELKVSWKLDGTNPAEAPNSIKVEMSFEFQSAKDLLGDKMQARWINIGKSEY